MARVNKHALSNLKSVLHLISAISSPSPFHRFQFSGYAWLDRNYKMQQHNCYKRNRFMQTKKNAEWNQKKIYNMISGFDHVFHITTDKVSKV